MMPSAVFTADMADSAKLHIEEARADIPGSATGGSSTPRPSPPQLRFEHLPVEEILAGDHSALDRARAAAPVRAPGFPFIAAPSDRRAQLPRKERTRQW